MNRRPGPLCRSSENNSGLSFEKFAEFLRFLPANEEELATEDTKVTKDNHFLTHFFVSFGATLLFSSAALRQLAPACTSLHALTRAKVVSLFLAMSCGFASGFFRLRHGAMGTTARKERPTPY
jgi:hypothetical protein